MRSNNGKNIPSHLVGQYLQNVASCLIPSYVSIFSIGSPFLHRHALTDSAYAFSDSCVGLNGKRLFCKRSAVVSYCKTLLQCSIGMFGSTYFILINPRSVICVLACCCDAVIWTELSLCIFNGLHNREQLASPNVSLHLILALLTYVV